jgi:hypothetical protein
MNRIDVLAITVGPGEGRSVSLGGMGVVFKASGANTGGAFAIVEHPIGAKVGDQEIVAGPGTYVIKPRELMHTFWNTGSGLARLLEVIAPAGFETYFIELAEAEVPDRRQELAAKYGVTYSSDWVAELTSRYNLKLLGSGPEEVRPTRSSQSRRSGLIGRAWSDSSVGHMPFSPYGGGLFPK